MSTTPSGGGGSPPVSCEELEEKWWNGDYVEQIDAVDRLEAAGCWTEAEQCEELESTRISALKQGTNAEYKAVIEAQWDAGC